jgi:glycerol-1-phosphate dehydrogenase [NAD(P)+]
MKNKDKVPSLEECLSAADETDALILKKGALEAIPDLLEKHYAALPVYLIADENTYAAAGSRVTEILHGRGMAVDVFIFPGEPRLHAEYRHTEDLIRRIRSLPDPKPVPLAVGGGTVNDLVKRAAAELSLPYLCVPTAASVDGYTSTGAALLKDGFKQTLPCPAPRVLAADTEVLAAAPAYLSSSGFGDLAGKLIAGTDWIIAETAGKLGAPGTEPIDPFAWSMTQSGLLEALENSAGAVRGDGEAVRVLFEALSLTGFAMQHLKSSRPVSGCEHLYSHVWEMENLEFQGVPVTHGHKVALGTLAATAFTETVFSRRDFSRRELPASFPGRPDPQGREAEVRAAFKGTPPEEGAVKTALEKLLSANEARLLTEALRDNWRTIRENVLNRLLPYEKLRTLMARGGCPLKPEEIGLDRTRTIATARRAQMIRNRYTVLDLAWDLGIFEEALATMEASKEYLY